MHRHCEQKGGVGKGAPRTTLVVLVLVLVAAQVVCQDFFHVAPRLLADVLFASPPWGGPKYKW